MHSSLSTFLSHSLQDSETLLSLSRSEVGAISLSLGLKTKRLPSSPCLLIHFHGGGFVAQTSKSHEVRWYSLAKVLNPKDYSHIYAMWYFGSRLYVRHVYICQYLTYL